MKRRAELVCSLYEQELSLMDEYANDINNTDVWNSLEECHQKRMNLQQESKLSEIFELVRGLDNAITIDLLFEDAESLGDNYLKMIPIYEHALQGCISHYGEYGEKTIECRLQIVSCIHCLCKEDEWAHPCYNHEMALRILEDLFQNRHEHPLYGTYIATLLSDEYLYLGKKQQAVNTFEIWSKIHPVENISDIEEMNSWIEYTLLLSELGYLKISIDNSQKICEWIAKNLPENDELRPYISRRISEIYVSCTLYQKAIDILETIIRQETIYSDKCSLETLNVKAQLAHCYYLNGERVTAAELIEQIELELKEKSIRHPSELQYENIKGNIEASLMNHREHYDRMLKIFSRSVQQHGKNHRDTVLYEFNLGNACYNIFSSLEDDNKTYYLNLAEKYMKDALERSTSSRIDDTLFALNIKRGLAEIVAEKGDILSAIKMMEEIWKKTITILTDDHNETIDVKIRYAALVLEAQQCMRDSPEWLDEINPEPILEECFQKKKEYLGMHHWETLDVLYWYARAVQSNEISSMLLNRKNESMEHSWQLHSQLLENISNVIFQAAYINSVEKQNQYMALLENEFEQLFWLMNCSIDSRSKNSVKKVYNWVASYKNISFDMQFRKLSDDKGRFQMNDLSTEKDYCGKISAIMANENSVFLDFWQEANAWIVFLINYSGIRYIEIDTMEDENIPYIDADYIPEQPQLDKQSYSLKERITLAEQIASFLAEELALYRTIYINLQKQPSEFPIASYLNHYTHTPVIVVPSIQQLIKQPTATRSSLQIGFLETKKSVDHLVVQNMVAETKCLADIPENCNIIHISGHGYYNNSSEIMEDMKNYIYLEGEKRLYIQDIIMKDMNGTDLVFLPVCQTGLGTNYSYFGIYSIGAAFRIAGAKMTIETLWDVPFSASIVFEYEFYRSLKEDEKISIAFSSAVNRLKSYRTDDLKAFCSMLRRVTNDRELVRIVYSEISNGEFPFQNPIFWAGFVLAGGRA